MEIQDYRKEMSQLELEIKSLRGKNDYLERNLISNIHLAHDS